MSFNVIKLVKPTFLIDPLTQAVSFTKELIEEYTQKTRTGGIVRRLFSAILRLLTQFI